MSRKTETPTPDVADPKPEELQVHDLATVSLAELEAIRPDLVVEVSAGIELQFQASAQAAVAAAVEAERERVLGIQAAGKGSGQMLLVAELMADPAVTIEAAKARLFDAHAAKRRAQADALRQDEAALDAPDPDDGGGSASQQRVERAVAAARRAGLA